jgi:methylthioribose-1-phosphate isomerase
VSWVEKFVAYMMESPEKVQEWAERLQILDTDFLMLTTVYVLYKTEEKVLNILSDMELKVDEAIGLVSTATANLLNALPQEDRKVVLAQVLLAIALQTEDASLRNSLAEYAKILLAPEDESSHAEDQETEERR